MHAHVADYGIGDNIYSANLTECNTTTTLDQLVWLLDLTFKLNINLNVSTKQ